MRQLIITTAALALLGGVAVAQEPPRLGIYFDPSGDMIVVEEVVPDTPAARAGLQAGDRIARFGGQRITSDSDLLGALGKVKQGETVTLQIVRDGKEIELPVTFGAKPAAKKEAAVPALPLIPMQPGAGEAPVAAGPLGELDGILARALESLEGDPGVGEIARARVLLRKARQELKEIAAMHPAPAAEPAAPSAPAPQEEPEGMMGGPEGMDFGKLTARIEELMGSGKSPEEIQKIIADEFPGIQVKINVTGMEEEGVEEVPEPARPTEPTTKPTQKAGTGK